MPATARKISVNATAGYRALDEIYQSNRVIVYRAVRETDGKAVILKVPRGNFQGPDNLSRFRHECEIVRNLNAKGTVTLYDADLQGRTPILVFEDFGGESLKKLSASQSFTLAECLTIGVKTADALASIHANGIIHRDISPANIVYNPRSEELKIIDFGLSTVLAREQPQLASPDVLEGTLAYISPEQTGRMNRSVDYRSDFYSFGASLYELLTGRPPFEESDPLSLMHAHLAKEPPSPSSVNGKIPEAVSAIVMKLLAKTAEDRYQSAQGIKQDLEECLRQLDETGSVNAFPLGRFDASDRLKPSQRLYGRETELQTLLAAFERAANGGREIALVTGYSGIGKTSLVHELYKPITAHRGYFISGKFDQLQRNVPYKAIINAFQELVRQLLGESEAKLAAWKEKLLTALRTNGRIIIDIIPEVELIIGPQPMPPSLEPFQEQNRFNMVLANFIRVFCKPEHPLTVYLDDLQWIDPASLKLLTYLLGDPSLRHLFFVGAYRDNEVDALHPLTQTLKRLEKTGTVIHTMSLRPLAPEYVRQLVADTLRMESTQVAPLADLVAKKTGGNPFFTEEFVKSLYAEGLLFFDRNVGAWHWDVHKIDAQNVTDNVVDLMVAKLKRLPAETQQVLQFAACIGNRFDLTTLAVICQKSIPQTMAALREAVAEEVVIPIGAALRWSRSGDAGAMHIESRFAHDRIQHAAYSLIPEAQRQAAHLEIGRLLLSDLTEEGRQERILEIVNQLNLGIDLITDEAEKSRLIDLNLEAGRKARRSNAYDAGLSYFYAALKPLSENGWARDYERTLVLHAEAARMAFLGRRLEEANKLVETVLANAKTLLDKIAVHEVKIESLIAAAKWRDAAEVGLAVLKSLGVSFPRRPSRWRIFWHYWRLKLLLLGKSKASLVNAPLMSDPYRLAEMRILSHVVTAVYFGMPALSPLVIIRAVQISVQYGNTPYSTFAYASYGALLCTGPQRMAEGRKFGELALALLDRLDAASFKSKVMNLVYGHINHWSSHLRETLVPIEESFRAGIETGDLEYASLSAITHVYTAFLSGLPLSTVETTAKEYARVAKGGSLDSIMLRRQLVLNLLGPTEDPCVLRGEACDEDTMLPRMIKANRLMGLLTFYCVKSTLAFLFERYDEALRYADKTRKYQTSSISIAMVPARLFTNALISLGVYAEQSDAERTLTLKKVDRILKKLRAWAAAAPMNHLHRIYLIEAERCRVLGRNKKAARNYDHAIACAKRDQYVFEEALANELAGRFYRGWGWAQLAQLYLHEARDIYARWGAIAKVKQMEAKYPFLTQNQTMFSEAGKTDSISATGSFSMDLKALMRALKDITSEQVHSHLLEKTIAIAMEVAGAQSALLFLRNDDDELFLEAEADINQDEFQILKSVPLADCKNVSTAVINYVRRAKQTVVIHDAQKPQNVMPGLNDDAYIKEHGVKSILCVPLLTGKSEAPELSGLLYLENNAATHTFTERVREPLEIICLAASGRLELSRKAVTDLLTNLYNHDYMQGILAKETSAAARTGRKLSLIMIDIDHFKKLNDEHGHQAGDVVLSEIAAIIKNTTRQSDVVARYGGEEMVVVLVDTDITVASEVAERVRTAIEAAVIPYDKKQLKVTASMGVATYGSTTSDPKTLVKAADQALYKSKHDGRNRVTAADVRQATE